MRFHTLDDWLTWQESLHAKKMDLGLERVRQALVRLGIQRPEHRILTVAGTNGKGSTVAVCANILSSAGYRVGTFTSPHLFHYRERISIAGGYLEDAELMVLFDAIDRARGTLSLTYFEFAFVAAALAFSRNNIHVAILEVGLGGRLDAVNALDPDAAMVVSVGLDHTAWLGDDREAIGFEKAGVFRPRRPAVVADPDPPQSVLDHAKSIGARVERVGQTFAWQAEPDRSGWHYRDDYWDLRDLPMPGGQGGYLLANAAGALALLGSVRQALPVPRAAITAGLLKPGPRGRLERHMIDNTEWVFDVAHNPDGSAALARELDLWPPKRSFGLVAVMADKDIAVMLTNLNSQVNDWCVTATGTGRGADPAVVAQYLAQLGADAVQVRPDLATAIEAIRDLASPGDRVIVFGSFHMVGPALEYLGLY